ncbi:MAG TPA: polysaccharide biosynthesis protein [Phycisphaerales bacterium]|nr:polysaccharide biosynthesis protein [Phycisphaerales bacterium]
MKDVYTTESKPGRKDEPNIAAVVLVGTFPTCRALAAQLETLPVQPRVLGWIDVAGSGGEIACAHRLGGLEDLERVLPELLSQTRTQSTPGPGLLCLVSLPRQLRAAWLRATASLGRHGVPFRSVTPIEDLLAGGGAAGDSSRPVTVDYSALIGRTPYGIDRRAVARLIEGKRVLITGAGGSIGSEIARIAATFSPAKLVLMERSENALFEINRRIGERFPGLNRSAVLHDVVDAPGTLRHLMALKPDVVFHAAAHKHVPLMEEHPAHAVMNNFFGTKSIADAALASGAERFVLISSDKAVKPTSVMGATKRLAEMYIQGLHRSVWSRRRNLPSSDAEGRTAFCMVRFGNVLGSACSVLPIWSSQIVEGGPVTVTDPRMTRYFMTIDEAAALVIQAGAIETSDPTARVYVLDMGQPVRILDLAQRFVRAAGFIPAIRDQAGAAVASELDDTGDASLPEMIIRLTGARPGEKLHEELAYAAELLQPTPYAGINAWAGPLGDDFSLALLVADLSAISTATERSTVLETIRRHVPELPRRGTISADEPDQTPSMPAQSHVNALQKTNTTIALA